MKRKFLRASASREFMEIVCLMVAIYSGVFIIAGLLT